jgi:hypothetical protein
MWDHESCWCQNSHKWCYQTLTVTDYQALAAEHIRPYIYDMIYLTAIGLPRGGSSTVHIYTEHNETEYTEQSMHNNKNT